MEVEVVRGAGRSCPGGTVCFRARARQVSGSPSLLPQGLSAGYSITQALQHLTSQTLSSIIAEESKRILQSGRRLSRTPRDFG